MTATKWIYDKYLEHGKVWVRENFTQFCVDVNPDRKNIDSYGRLIRLVSAQLKIDHPELFNSEPLPENAVSSDVANIDQALDYHNIDLSSMKITGARVNTWGSANNQNKQVRLELKPIDGPDPEKLAQDFIDAIKDYQPPKLPNVKAIGDCMLEVDLFDVHFGLLAWGQETGFGDYDIKIASEMFMNIIHKIINWSKTYKIERILFPIGNDFFNSDNPLNSTAKGTIQDEDTRWMKTFSMGWKLVRDAVILLREIAPVSIIVIRGNHDLTRAYYMGTVIEAWFKDDKSIAIDNGPEYYKRFKYGKNLIGFTHGDKAMKSGQLPLLMASHWADDWASTKYREWRVGHVHHESTKEFPGCKVMTLGASSRPSEWGASEGFDSMTEAKGSIWNKENGKIATMHCRPDIDK